MLRGSGFPASNTTPNGDACAENEGQATRMPRGSLCRSQGALFVLALVLLAGCGAKPPPDTTPEQAVRQVVQPQPTVQQITEPHVPANASAPMETAFPIEPTETEFSGARIPRPRPADAPALAELSVEQRPDPNGGAMVTVAPAEPPPEILEPSAPSSSVAVGEAAIAESTGAESGPVPECDCGDLFCSLPMEQCGEFSGPSRDDAGGAWMFGPVTGPASHVSPSELAFPFEDDAIDLIAIVLAGGPGSWAGLFTTAASEVLTVPDFFGAATVTPLLLP
jgi:hypothetical protein